MARCRVTEEHVRTDGFLPDTANCFQISDTPASLLGPILRLLWCMAMCTCPQNMMTVIHASPDDFLSNHTGRML